MLEVEHKYLVHTDLLPPEIQSSIQNVTSVSNWVSIVKASAKLSCLDSCTFIRQGYVSTQKELSIRIRIANDQAFITLKGASLAQEYSALTSNPSPLMRVEYEYPIPLGDGVEMLETLCKGRIINKTRYGISYSSLLWEIDVFHGNNAGLVLAEVELPAEGRAEGPAVELPPWVSQNVSGDERYQNHFLAVNPWSEWN